MCLKEYILNKIFVVSTQPVRFGDLLEANALFNEGMMIDPAKLNFKFNYTSLYAVYSVICAVLLIAGILVSHKLFKNIDFHFSIVSTAIITALVFAGFDAFKIWARKQISARLIKEAWKLHFAYFDYEKNSAKVEEFYKNALKDKISQSELEKYILERLVDSK